MASREPFAPDRFRVPVGAVVCFFIAVGHRSSIPKITGSKRDVYTLNKPSISREDAGLLAPPVPHVVVSPWENGVKTTSFSLYGEIEGLFTV